MISRNTFGRDFRDLGTALGRIREIADRLRQTLEAASDGMIEGTTIPGQNVLEELGRLGRSVIELQHYVDQYGSPAFSSSQLDGTLGFAQLLDDSKEMRRLYQNGLDAWGDLGERITWVITQRLLQEMKAISPDGVDPPQHDPLFAMADDFGDVDDAVEAYLAIEAEEDTRDKQTLHDVQLLQLRYQLGLSQQVIADLMGGTQAATANRLNRALNRLAVRVATTKLVAMAKNEEYEIIQTESYGRRSSTAARADFQIELEDSVYIGIDLFISSTAEGEPPKTDESWYKRALIGHPGHRINQDPGSENNVPNMIPVMAIYRRKTADLFLCLAYRLPEQLGFGREPLASSSELSLDQMFVDVPTNFRELHRQLRAGLPNP